MKPSEHGNFVYALETTVSNERLKSGIENIEGGKVAACEVAAKLDADAGEELSLIWFSACPLLAVTIIIPAQRLPPLVEKMV